MDADSLAVIAVTEEGARLAHLISGELNAELYLPESMARQNATPYSSLKECFASLMSGKTGIVAVMAQGIVTRMVAPHLKSKYEDPAVVTCDEVGRFAISTLSGHEGGANLLAHAVASVTGATPVITTATEANRRCIIGIGCRRGTGKDEIIHAVKSACANARISVSDLRLAASAWVKKDEAGLQEAVRELGLYIRFLPKKAYQNSLYRFTNYDAPMRHFGIPGVAEPSAILAAMSPKLILKRTVFGSVTAAVVREEIYYG
jgi:cobalt-precorrin 5A hydrolase